MAAKPGVARIAANDVQNKALAAMKEWLADAKRPKIVHDPKLFHLLAAPESPAEGNAVAGIRHATMLYSYLLRPTTANHAFAEVVLRHLNFTLSGAPGERADFLTARSRRFFAPKWKNKGSPTSTRKSTCRSRRYWLAWRRRAFASIRRSSTRISTKMQEEIGGLEKSIYELAGFEFKINSPQQLAEVLFDKLNLQPPRKTRGKARSTAADVLDELALVHEMPKKVLAISRAHETEVHVCGRVAAADSSRCQAALHTRFNQTGTATGRLSSSNPNLQNIPVRTELGREIRAAFVASPGNLLLSADYSQIELRILAHLSEGSNPHRSVSPRRRYSLANGTGSVRRGAVYANARASPRRKSDQFRRDLWAVGIRARAATRH